MSLYYFLAFSPERFGWVFTASINKYNFTLVFTRFVGLGGPTNRFCFDGTREKEKLYIIPTHTPNA